MAAPSSLLRGELYKADQMGAIFKLRWVELWAGGKGELRWGYPGPNAGTTDRGISDLSGATVSLGAEEWRGAEARFGFQVTPRSRPRTYFFQASSAEERRLWVDAIENVASPDVTRSNLGGGYRLIFMVRPQYPRPWGIDLGSAPGLPCVTVLEVAGEEARAVGLLAGDVVLTLGNTVLRTATVAQRAFREAPYGRVTMRLVTHNREVSSTSRQHQPAAPASSTSWRDDSLATHSLTRDPQPRGLGTPPATAVPSRARPAHEGLHHEAPVAAALLLGPARGRRRHHHALPRRRRRRRAQRRGPAPRRQRQAGDGRRRAAVAPAAGLGRRGEAGRVGLHDGPLAAQGARRGRDGTPCGRTQRLFTSGLGCGQDEEGKLGVRLSDGPRHSPPVLSEVARSSSAWSAGLRAGDAVVGVSGEADSSSTPHRLTPRHSFW
mmetsp:Transcript_34145/g.101433  ORF Transcript_34145/g.101433 Transcript_34145/m.101433 type:complete len:435 (+) Transcript_34145:99-1403(+)